MNNRSRAQGVTRDKTNVREKEKQILDKILQSNVYDRRIRPSGANGTGNKLCAKDQKGPQKSIRGRTGRVRAINRQPQQVPLLLHCFLFLRFPLRLASRKQTDPPSSPST